MRKEKRPEQPIAHLMQQHAVKLDKNELLERGKALAHIEEDLAKHHEHAKEVRDGLKLREQELLAKRSVLATVVRRGEESRDVEVSVYPHPSKSGWVREVRDDTGEVVRERPAREDEQQAPLFE